MDTIKVVCGIIFNDDKKVFICRRKPEKSLGGHWEFPGGKVESGEAFEDTLIRELKEELGMEVEVLKHYKTVLHQYDNFNIELISFLCQYHKASFELTDHDKIEWVDIIELPNWKLAPADIPISIALLNQNQHVSLL